MIVDKDLRIYLPNVISLHQEGNNTFYPQSYAIDLRIIDLSVYDRWGTLVFNRKDFPLNVAELGWDGFYNGEPAYPGAYAYRMEFSYEGEIETRFGTVTLLR